MQAWFKHLWCGVLYFIVYDYVAYHLKSRLFLSWHTNSVFTLTWCFPCSVFYALSSLNKTPLWVWKILLPFLPYKSFFSQHIVGSHLNLCFILRMGSVHTFCWSIFVYFKGKWKASVNSPHIYMDGWSTRRDSWGDGHVLVLGLYGSYTYVLTLLQLTSWHTSCLCISLSMLYVI